MIACLCTHSYHDEIFNFTGVEKTKHWKWCRLHLFGNANVNRIQKTSWKKYQM